MPAPVSKSDALYTQIREDILSLDLPPGAPLRLPAISDRYGIGLTPLRECLNRLSAENLVLPEHNKGFRVSLLSLTELLDLEGSRSVVEGALFAQSVEAGEEDWEAAVVGAFHHLAKTPFPSVLEAPDELQTWHRRHAAFHAALTAAAPSVMLRRFRDALSDQLRRYHVFIQNSLQELSRTMPEKAAWADEVFSSAMRLAAHQTLYDVALDRDTGGATAAFAEHSNLSSHAFRQLVTLIPTGSDLDAQGASAAVAL
ncbi:MAG: GntR family transcriptional regulator [Pseudomonadota bacterium]